jgi:hypothetical protein
MAAIAVTAANVRPVYPGTAIIRSRKLAVAVTAGQALYLTTAGKAGLCDANAAGAEQFAGIALEPGAIGDTISVIEMGEVAGFTFTQDVGALIYQGDTAGELADAASATKTVAVGKVDVVYDSAGTAQKCLFVSRNRIANF